VSLKTAIDCNIINSSSWSEFSNNLFFVSLRCVPIGCQCVSRKSLSLRWFLSFFRHCHFFFQERNSKYFYYSSLGTNVHGFQRATKDLLDLSTTPPDLINDVSFSSGMRISGNYFTCHSIQIFKSYAGDQMFQDLILRTRSDSVFSKDGHLFRNKGRKRNLFQWICTGLFPPRGQRLGEHQRRTAWWARHRKKTADNHLVQRVLALAIDATAFFRCPNLLKRMSTKLSLYNHFRITKFYSRNQPCRENWSHGRPWQDWV